MHLVFISLFDRYFLTKRTIGLHWTEGMAREPEWTRWTRESSVAQLRSRTNFVQTVGWLPYTLSFIEFKVKLVIIFYPLFLSKWEKENKCVILNPLHIIYSSGIIDCIQGIYSVFQNVQNRRRLRYFSFASVSIRYFLPLLKALPLLKNLAPGSDLPANFPTGSHLCCSLATFASLPRLSLC